MTLITLTACATTGSGAGLSLMDAIEQTGEKIAGELPEGSRVAIVAFESASDKLSDFIMEELTGVLFDRGIEVADRQNLEYVYKELNFQMGGDVSDKSAKSIGKFLAADMVITGQLLDLDGMYRYRTSAINVETAIRASVTRLDVRSDRAARRMVAALARQKTTVKTAKYGVSADVTPQTAGTFLDQGIMFASRGEYANAIADFDSAIRLNPDMVAAYYFRGSALLASVSRVSNVKDNFDFSITQQRATAEQARVIDLAIADFSLAIRLDPNDASAYNTRGIAYGVKGDFDRAVADFNEAIRLDPNYAAAYSNRGVAYGEKGDFDRAVADSSLAIRLDPNDAGAYNSRGVAYEAKGDFDRAVADRTEARRLGPECGD
ncbi:MAG: tetratricopeptide repeat protein, partial [Treponema sp.]|nr:tetratricopeptide repeat protein [Treponema sp.]